MKKYLIIIAGLCLTLAVVLKICTANIPVTADEINTGSETTQDMASGYPVSEWQETERMETSIQETQTVENSEEQEGSEAQQETSEVSKEPQEIPEVSEESQETPEVSEESQETPELTEEQQIIQTVTSQIGLTVDTVEIDLPNVEASYELLFINDMHILTVDATVVEEQIPVVQNRYENMFCSGTGTHSPDTWLALSSVIDYMQADAVLFGGDMMDFVSPNNVELFRAGLDQIKTPYMYLRADHDLGTWYSGGLISGEDALALHDGICNFDDMYVMEFADFYVLGWNNSTSQLTEKGWQTAMSIWDSGKPIILATHVPVNSTIDLSLAEESARTDPQGRIKLWGDGCLYQPYDYTSAFLQMLYEEQSPVKAVLSGHLHFKHTVPLTEQTMEYVFAPAFAGNIACIKIY